MRFRILASRLLDLVLRRRRDERLADEIRLHLDELTDGFVDQGMSRTDAENAARKAFGGVDRIRALYREQQGLPWFETALQDIRFASRLLLKDRWFTAAAVTALALGIGVNTTVFTIINGMNWQSLPVADPERVVHLVVFDENDRRAPGVSEQEFRERLGAARSFAAGLAAYVSEPMNVGDEERPADQLVGTFVSANAFDVLGVQPSLGRSFRVDDDRSGAPPVAILGYQAWASRYGADAAVIGQTIRINGVSTTLVGIMPAGFQFPVQTDIWQPLAARAGGAPQRLSRSVGVFGRVRDDVSIDQARAEVRTIGASFETATAARSTRISGLLEFTEFYVGPVTEGPPAFLMAAVMFVLLIACANVANLLIARSAVRAREIALRATLGASRWRIVRQLLVESLLLAIVAGVIGLVLAVAGVRAFRAETADLFLPYWIQFVFDARVFAFLAAVCVGTAITFGLAPAWRLARVDMHDVLKAGGRGAGSGGRSRWTGTLIVGELALTVVLLASAGLVLRAAVALYQADVLIDMPNVLTARLSLPPRTFASEASRTAFYNRLAERLDANQQAVGASLTTALPFTGAPPRPFAVERADAPLDPVGSVMTIGVGDRYFETLGVHLVRGREFDRRDGPSGESAVIVNTRFAELYLNGEEPVGRRVRIATGMGDFSGATWRTIVAVAPSIRQGTMRMVAPTLYIPFRAEPPANANIVARPRSDLSALERAVRRDVQSVDRDVALFGAASLERISERSRSNPRIIGLLASLFAGIAMLLSAMGLYAVTAYAVGQRAAEIGVRVALGARRAQVLWLFMKAGIIQLAAGLVLGLAGAIGVAQLLRSIIVSAGVVDPVVLSAVSALLGCVVIAACLIPARRATALDPVAALRHD